MNRYIALCTALLAITYTHATSLKQKRIFSVSEATHAKQEQKIASFHYMNAISKTDFRASGETSLMRTFSITSAGTYTLVQDITHLTPHGASAGASVYAIYVNSDNVVVDLGGHNIIHSGDSNNVNNGAIQINGKKNILIKNGNLSNFAFSIDVKDGASDIRLNNLTVSKYGNIGVRLGSSSGSGVQNVTMADCIVAGGVENGTQAGATSIKIHNAHNILMEDCLLGRNTSSSGVSGDDAVGVYIETSTNVICSNIDAGANQASSALGNAYGFTSNDRSVAGLRSHGLIFKNCVANGNYSYVKNGRGFFIEEAQGCLFESCQANSNQGGSIGSGFALSNFDYSLLKNCVALDNRSNDNSSSASAGFSFTDCLGNTIDSCTSIGTVRGSAGDGPSSGDAIGFELVESAGCAYNTFHNCTAIANGSLNYDPNGVGFYVVTNGIDNTTFENCHSYSNLSKGNSGIGFKDGSTASTSFVKNSFSFGNKNNAGTFSEYSFTFPFSGAIAQPNSDITPGSLDTITELKPLENMGIKGR